MGVPFQCEFCWFVNLMRRNPLVDSLHDCQLMDYMRRVNLDMMWSREEKTVAGILSNVRKGKRMSDALGIEPLNLPMGPWPIQDGLGFQVALEMLRASQEKGRNASDHQQFDSLRKMRAAYSNIYESSPAGVAIGLSFKGPKGSMVHFSQSELNSVLYRHFIHGLLKRMGRLVIQNIAISPEMLLLILEQMEEELRSIETQWERKRELIMCGGAFVSLFAAALRGEEVFMIEGRELCKRIQEGKGHRLGCHVYLPLMGRFKHETGERNILFALTSVTASGLRVRRWIERLAAVLVRERKNLEVGPALCDVNGFCYQRWKLNMELHNQLEALRTKRPDLIAEDLDVTERFGIHRSFRRGATTKAQQENVPHSVIVMNNRWRKSQERSGGMPSLPMAVLYTEMQQALLTRLKFSRSL